MTQKIYLAGVSLTIYIAEIGQAKACDVGIHIKKIDNNTLPFDLTC